VKADSKGNPLYVARVQLEVGKVIYANFSATGGGVNFWLPAIAAANELSLDAYQERLGEQMKSEGAAFDLEPQLLEMAGKSVQVFLKVKEWNGVVSNEIEKWKAIDA